jgi:hypothetical protein
VPDDVERVFGNPGLAYVMWCSPLKLESQQVVERRADQDEPIAPRLDADRLVDDASRLGTQRLQHLDNVSGV